MNASVYAATSIAVRDGQTNSAQAQPFFVSRTRFAEEQYAAASIAPVLERAGVTATAYAREGLFVLRSTVMNPWYGEAEVAGMDYLRAFVGHLHRTTYSALRGHL